MAAGVSVRKRGEEMINVVNETDKEVIIEHITEDGDMGLFVYAVVGKRSGVIDMLRRRPRKILVRKETRGDMHEPPNEQKIQMKTDFKILGQVQRLDDETQERILKKLKSAPYSLLLEQRTWSGV